jgi:GMP reductase
MERYYSYSDITLIPNFSNLPSRSLADVSQKLVEREFKLPIYPSNMKCTIDRDLAIELARNGYFYCMHRFDHDQLSFVRSMQETNNVSISVGVGTADKKLINIISAAGMRVDFITVDVAHGHHDLVGCMIVYIKERLPDSKIIAGNIATVAGAKYLKSLGADAVKVGIGQGAACTTKDKTGFTLPMFTCVQKISENVDIPIIADGGIRCNGDIAKALVAGATMVMAGSIFASCTDSPSNTVNIDGKKYKEYYGSASFHNKGHSNNIEGTMTCIPCSGMTYVEKLNEITQDLQSAASYAGKNSISPYNIEELNVRLSLPMTGVQWATIS